MRISNWWKIGSEKPKQNDSEGVKTDLSIDTTIQSLV